MAFYLKMSPNTNSTTRYLNFTYILILVNFLRTGNETKSAKTMYN